MRERNRRFDLVPSSILFSEVFDLKPTSGLLSEGLCFCTSQT